MPHLELSASVRSELRELVEEGALPAALSGALGASLSSASGAVPHRDLVSVSRCTSVSLSSLLRASRVYIPPAPKFARSPELEATLARIQRQVEEQEYAQLTGQPQKEQHEQWKEVSDLLALVANVAISMLAVAAAVFWGTGNTHITTKTLLALGAAILTAVAEVVLYARYQSYVAASRAERQRRMTGFEHTQAAVPNLQDMEH